VGSVGCLKNVKNAIGVARICSSNGISGGVIDYRLFQVKSTKFA